MIQTPKEVMPSLPIFRIAMTNGKCPNFVSRFTSQSIGGRHDGK